MARKKSMVLVSYYGVVWPAVGRHRCAGRAQYVSKANDYDLLIMRWVLYTSKVGAVSMKMYCEN